MYQLCLLNYKWMNKEDQHYDYVVRILFVGNSNVGKTAFINRFCSNTYTQKMTSTIGIDYQRKIVQSNNQKYLLQLFDTAGQEKFKTITPSYYRSAMAIILCYSVQDRESFSSLVVWLKQIKKYTEEEIPVIIVGNKCDLVRRQVLERQGKNLADTYEIDFLQASAKQDINVSEVIHKILKKVKVKVESQKERKSFKIGDSKNKPLNSSCSC